MALVLSEHAIEDLAFDCGDEERWEVSVVTEGIHSGKDEVRRGEVGRTVVTKVKEGEGKGGVKIPRGLDVERFWAVLEECVIRAEMNVL